MVKIIKTKDKSLEVKLFDDGMIEIESAQLKNVSIEIKRVDPTNILSGVPNSIYQISIYKSELNAKVTPSEYGLAWVLADGSIIKNGDEYREHMKKFRK